MLEDAIMLAARSHRGVTDKAGAPYILHPLRMMLRLDTDEERMAAVLHDVVEDTGVTLEDLRRAGYPDVVVEAVDHLTWRKEEESYEDFIRRAASHPVARKVKLVDLEDNMDLKRLAELTPTDLERLDKYHRMRRWLLDH